MRLMILALFWVIPLSSFGHTYGQKMVAAVLMGEAWGDGTTGMGAVAEVVRNRAAESGLSPLAVVSSPRQFSCLNRATVEQLYGKYSRHPDYQKALKISRLLYNQPKSLGRSTRGANHFTRTDERPEWSQGRQPVAIIGGHAFYRLEPPVRGSRARMSEIKRD